MKIPLSIVIEDATTCNQNCPFLEDGGCLLFNIYELDVVELAAGRCWQDGVEPHRRRAFKCTMLDLPAS